MTDDRDAQPESAGGPAVSATPDEPAAPVVTVADVARRLEAILLIVEEPQSLVSLAAAVGAPVPAVRQAIEALVDDYDGRSGGPVRGFELREVGGGWRFYTRDTFAPVVEKFVLDGQQARLTQAALETLAVVAYRQPVSRSRVSAVRGVNCDGVMRTLLQRGLVEEAGTEPETGAILYRTTNYFLERMGLRGLDELPELAPFLPEADAIEAETLEGVPSFDPDAPDTPDTHADDKTEF